ncbi:MAG: hypothetical protein DRI24_17005, partial [Deltaproteobacteria bacterium]
RARGRDSKGNYVRTVDFPRIIRNTDTYTLERLGVPLGAKPLGAFIGIECSYYGTYPGLKRAGEAILDPMLAYQVALLKYGYEEMKNSHYMRPGNPWNPPEPMFLEGFEAPVPNKTVKAGARHNVESVTIPTFGVGPRGYCASTLGEEADRNNAVLNCYLAAISFGAGTMKAYDNVIPSFRPDDSADRINEIKSSLEESGLLVIADNGWRGRSGGRCITDYSREVTFNREVTDEELCLYREMLSLDSCPGYTGVLYRKLSVSQFSFSTTMDSSD